MSCAYLAFTERGLALAQQWRRRAPARWLRCGAGGPGLDEWTAAQFAASDALIYIGRGGGSLCGPLRRTAAARRHDPSRGGAG